MKKSVFSIDRGHLQRSFFGTHDLKRPQMQAWFEAGHYYAGFELVGDVISDPDGLGRKNPTIDGYQDLGILVTGSGEPAQNDEAALGFYKSMMNGTRNAAFLTQTPNVKVGTLWLFRLVDLGGGVWQDNRISISTAQQYAGRVLKGKTEISGYVAAYETYFVLPSSVIIAHGQLNFTKLSNPSSIQNTGA